jgi:hypothetical protein
MESILKELQKLHDDKLWIVGNRARNCPSLYHYTSLQSSLEIIKNNTLRFTNILYLNDPIELTHGLEIAEKVMVELIKKDSSEWVFMLAITIIKIAISLTPINKKEQKKNFLIKKLNHYIATNPRELNEILSKDSDWSIYVFCLSEKKDYLLQWLAYGDNARGAALEFKKTKKNTPHEITELDEIPGISLSYCTPKDKKKFLREFLKSAENLYKDKIAKDKDLFTPYFTKLQEILLFDLVACKNPQYKDEEEWRLFFIDKKSTPETASDAFPQQQPSFDVKNGFLRPYYDFKLKKGAITGIKLGAQCQNDLNIDAFRMLCDKHKLCAKHEMPNFITKSKMHYRG